MTETMLPVSGEPAGMDVPVPTAAPLPASAPVSATVPPADLLPAFAPAVNPAPPADLSPALAPAAAPAPPAALLPAGVPAPASAPAVDLAALLDEPPLPPWYRRGWVLAAALLLLCSVAGIWWWYARQAALAAPHFVTQAVVRGDLTLTVAANGTIQPTRSINIGSELSGTVLKVNVDVNDLIRKGQVLVELDPAKLQDQVLRSQALLAVAEAKLRQTAATVTESRSALDRLEAVARLSGGKVPSQTELDAARATRDRAVADDLSARASIRDATAALSTDQTNLGKASISAPADGVVLTRNVDPGNAVAASLQAVTLFVVAENLARLRLWVYVDEADVGWVKKGQDARFTVSAYPNRYFPARITRVGFGSTITDNVVTYLTYLDVDNADLSLRPGMTATATINATHRSDVLLVPNTALRFAPVANVVAAPAAKGILASLVPSRPGRPDRKSAAAGASTVGARRVWILPSGGDGTPLAVAVVAGISDGRLTEIVSGDLRAGMLVITDQKSTAAK